MMVRRTRREAIVLATRGLLGGLLFCRLPSPAATGSPMAALQRSSPAEALQRRLVAMFEDSEAAAAVGRVYLRQRPYERDSGRLLALLQESDGHDGVGVPGPDDDDMGDPKLHDLLRERTREDFAMGRTVWVDGWLLAQTEARLLALAALA